MAKVRHISEIISEMVRESQKTSKEAIPYHGSYAYWIFKAMEDVELEMRDAI